MAWYARLTWQEGNLTYKGNGFKVYVSVNNASPTLAATLPITTTQYDYAVSPGNKYTFYVKEYKSVYIAGSWVDYESPAATVTVYVPGNPQLPMGVALSSTTAAVKSFIGGCTVQLRYQKYASGTWQDLQVAPNLVHTQGGALGDWTRWDHYGNTAYWAASFQEAQAGMGLVFKGQANPAAATVYLYDYNAYTVTSGTPYVFGIALKAEVPTTVRLQAYIYIGGTTYNGQEIHAFLDGTWRWFWWTIVPGQSASGTAGIGLRIIPPRPHSLILYAACPYFGEAAVDTIAVPCVRKYRVRAESESYYSDWFETPNMYFWKKAQLTWQEGKTSEKGECFIIEKKIGTGSWYQFHGVPITTLTFDDTETPENTTIYYRVYEAYGGRLSPASSTVSLTVPVGWVPQDNKPQNLTVTIIR